MRDNTTLKVDWDRKEFPDVVRIRRLLARAGFRLVACGCRRSPSQRGWHLYLVTTPKPASLVEVVALQAMVGSDPWREAMTFYRAKRAVSPRMRDMVNVLYAPCTERRREVKRKC